MQASAVSSGAQPNQLNALLELEPSAEWETFSLRGEKIRKLLDISDRIRSVLLWNRWAPWAVYLPYLGFEYVLKHSPRTRARWSEHLKTKPRRNKKKLEQAYPYQDLESNVSIRLLHVLPGRADDPISCDISHHRLDRIPDYIAISYSWIDDMNAEPKTLMCGRHKIIVQNTIFQLLQRLRKVDQTLVLWIDAICINQANNKERDSQVEMMGRIYSSASSVVVWVGEADDRTARLAAFLHTTMVEQGMIAQLEHPETSTNLQDEIGEDTEAFPVPKKKQLWRMGLEWLDLAMFLERAWFTRTWVLQEVCLAKECELHCGPYRWPWMALQEVFEHLNALETADTPGAVRRLNQGVITFSRNWEEIKDQPGISMAQLLTATKGTYASMAVDKVYGTLSLAHDRLGIQVQYDKPVQKVFEDVARRLLLAKGAPYVLSAASDNLWNETRGLPSWVPDWACMDKPASLNALSERNARLSQALLSELDASSNLSSSIEAGTLKLKMRRIDTVRATGVPWPGNGHERDSQSLEHPFWEIGSSAAKRLQQWRSMLPQCTKGDRKTYAPTEEHRLAALMRTMVADVTALPSCCSEWGAVYPLFQSRLDRLRWLKASMFHSEFRLRKDPLADYHDAVKAVCHKRTLIFTKRGYMGVGPFNTLPFDSIFVVPGLKTPMVMRKDLGGRYKLIGECYLHGWSRPDNVGQSSEMMTLK